MPIKGDDWATVAAAITAGKIDPKNHDTWLNALGADREGTKRVLASLTALPTNLRRPSNQVKNSDTPTSAAPRVTGTDGNLERVEIGREPTQKEDLDAALFRMTFGKEGKPAPEHIVYFRDTNQPRLIDHGDGTAHWESPGATSV